MIVRFIAALLSAFLSACAGAAPVVPPVPVASTPSAPVATTPLATPLGVGSGGLPIVSAGRWYSADGPRGTVTYLGNFEAALVLHRPALRFAGFGSARPPAGGEYVAFAVTMEVLRPPDGGVAGFLGPIVCKVKDDAGRALSPARFDKTTSTELTRALGVAPDLTATAVGDKVTSVFVYVAELPVAAVDADCRFPPSGPQTRYAGPDLLVWRPG